MRRSWSDLALSSSLRGALTVAGLVGLGVGPTGCAQTGTPSAAEPVDGIVPLEDVGVAAEAIVNGTAGGNAAVVWIYNNENGGLCTGTLIHPRVVLSAKHCVQDSGASGPSSAFQMIVGTGNFAGSGRTLRVQSVRTTPGVWREGGASGLSGSLVGEDVSVMVLTTPVTDITPIPVMREHPRSLAGQVFTAVGFGQTPQGQAGRKYTVQGRVNSVAQNLILVGSVTCQGDSGGPLITQANEVGGVVSFGAGECGTGYNAYNQIYAYLDMIDAALEEAGACIEAEEICDGRDNDCDDEVDEVCTPLGAGCTTDDECMGGMCRDTTSGRICTTACDPLQPALGCDESFYCSAASGSCDGFCVPGAGGAHDRAIDAECTQSDQCASYYCGDLGNGSRRCQEPCRGGAGSCIAGDICRAATGVCAGCISGDLIATPRNFGEACSAELACAEGLTCYEDTATPETTRSYCSRACTDDASCGANYHCRAGTCAAGRRGGVGDLCGSAEDCAAGAICASTNGRSWCTVVCPVNDCPGGFMCQNAGSISVCAPVQGLLNDACTAPESCVSATCAQVESGGVCTRLCSPSNPCPSGLECRRTDGVTGACFAPPRIDHGGCSVSPARTGSFASLTALAGAVALLARRRQRRKHA